MAIITGGKRISALNQLVTPQSTAIMPIVDVGETQYITLSDLENSIGGGVTITNDGIDRILTSNNDGTVNAESNLIFNGTDLSIGDITVSGGGISSSSTLTLSAFGFQTAVVTSTALRPSAGGKSLGVPGFEWSEFYVDNLSIDQNTISSTDTNGNIILDPNGLGRIEANRSIRINDGTLSIAERSNPPSPSNGYGSIWVQDDVPNTLWFTDDNGDDYQLNSGGSDGASGSLNVSDGNGGFQDTLLEVSFNTIQNTSGNVVVEGVSFSGNAISGVTSIESPSTVISINDSISVVGTITSGTLIPVSSNTFDVGTSSNQWGSIFVENIESSGDINITPDVAGDVNIGSNISVSSATTSFGNTSINSVTSISRDNSGDFEIRNNNTSSGSDVQLIAAGGAIRLISNGTGDVFVTGANLRFNTDGTLVVPDDPGTLLTGALRYNNLANGQLEVYNGSFYESVGGADLGDLVITNGDITQTTSDGADNAEIHLASGGAVNTNRGAFIAVYGNERASAAGDVFIRQGNVSGAETIFTTGAGTESMILDDSGNLRIASYGSGSVSGTATQALAVDSSGNVIEIGLGGVSGSYTPTFTDVSGTGSVSLGNAHYTQVGDVVTGSVKLSLTRNTATYAFRFTLPVSHTLTDIDDIVATKNYTITNSSITINADTVNNEVFVSVTSSSGPQSNRPLSIIFTYTTA